MTASRPYKLLCQVCGKEFVDDGFRLACDGAHEPGLLITAYAARQFEAHLHSEDVYRYQNWLPIMRTLPGTRRTVIFQSESLSRITRLPHLWIAFNGYWPEKGARLGTATFKDLEASVVLARLPEDSMSTLVVASAGNSAAAFADFCSRCKFPCLIIMPEQGLQSMQFTGPLDSCVRIVVLRGFVDYYDAIVLANRVATYDGFILEGGVQNVARRDGLGTVLLSAVEVMGQLPDYYFQAIGSGAGGIAVHDTAKKLVCDGRFGQSYPRLMLSQNTPFAPMYHSWKAGCRCLIDVDRAEGKKQIQQIAAQVLSNQKPPYSIGGGVFDALQESRGDMLVADNAEVMQAMNIFQEAEGIEIDPAAGVAFATLLKQASRGYLERDARVLLNITGGGQVRRSRDLGLMPAVPALHINDYELPQEQTVERVVRLFS